MSRENLTQLKEIFTENFSRSRLNLENIKQQKGAIVATWSFTVTFVVIFKHQVFQFASNKQLRENLLKVFHSIGYNLGIPWFGSNIKG